MLYLHRCCPEMRGQFALLFSHAPKSVINLIINCVCPNSEAALVRLSLPLRPLGVTSGASIRFFPNRIHENGRAFSQITYVTVLLVKTRLGIRLQGRKETYEFTTAAQKFAHWDERSANAPVHSSTAQQFRFVT